MHPIIGNSSGNGIVNRNLTTSSAYASTSKLSRRWETYPFMHLQRIRVPGVWMIGGLLDH